MMRLVTTVTLLIGIHLSWGLDKETIVSIDDKDKTQYHEVNFDTRSYNFGYEVGENRQFHHEIRGADGVTYGCFGYFDPDDKLLMTYYVADAHGYRLIEANKPTKIYPVVTDPKLSNENSIDAKVVHTEWKDLFLPNGCRMIERGIFNDVKINTNRNRAGIDGAQFPQPGIGNDEGSNNGNDPSRSSVGPITGGIGGGFEKPNSSGGFGIVGSHGTNQNNNNNHQLGHQTPPPPPQNQNPGSSFGIGGGFAKPDGSQGSFQLGFTKPPHEHGSHLGSLHNHSLTHGHGSGQHVIQKPPGSIGGISWTGHNITIQKPTIDHSGNHSHSHVHQKPPGSIQGVLGGGVSWSGQNVTIHKPTFEHLHNHSHGHEHGSGQHVIQKPPGQIGGISWSGQNITIHKPSLHHNHSHVHEKPPGHIDHGGSFGHGNTQGGHQGGVSWGNQNQQTTQRPGGQGNQGQQQGSGNNNQGGYYGGQYYPDYSGQYHHQPGPNAPPYHHIHGPWGGQGSHGYGGGSGTDGGYGNNGNYGPNGPNYGYEHGHNQGGYRPDPNNPDSHCNNPDHNHYNPSTQQPYRPTNSRPSTFPPYTTTQRTTTTTKRPQTYPTRPSSTPNPTGSGYGNLGVQPPSTQRPVTQNPAYIQPGSHPPLFFVPYPFPTAPTCPCYYMHSHGSSGNYSSQFDHINGQFQWQSQYQNSQQPYAIGFIPVLFIPHCMPPNGNPNQIPGQYMQVPYPCAQCNQLNRDALNIDDSFSSSDSFQQVLAQAGVNSLDSFLVKSPPRRLRMRMKKQKRIETNESQNNTA